MKLNPLRACLSDENSCKYVVKVAYFNKYVSRAFEREYSISKLAGTHHIGPLIKKSFTCYDESLELRKNFPLLTFIVMDQWDMSLNHYLKKEDVPSATAQKILDDLSKKLKELLELGIWHRKLKTDNVVVNLKKGKYFEIAIIDYGKAVEFGRDRTVREVAQKESEEFLVSVADRLHLFYSETTDVTDEQRRYANKFAKDSIRDE